jgi:Mlc titration factor MtfA (ptsG expression regulator)
VSLAKLLDFFWIVFPWAVGAAIAATAYRLVPRLAPLLRFLPGHPRVRFRREPIPPHWREIVARNVPLAARLSAPDQERLLRLAQVFLHDKPMEGVGLELTDEIRVTVAAQACLLLLNLDYPCYPKLRRVLIYPGTFHPRRVDMPRFGEIHQEPRATLGEAWTSGVVVLSWDSSLVGSLNPEEGHNVVLHEFAHVLDGENGAMDGLPLLDHPSAYRTWGYVFRSLYERQVEAALQGGETPLHPYGATNRAEFFAVATEAFFQQPAELKQRLPDLYDELRKFYRQDPSPPGSADSSGAPASTDSSPADS